MATVTATRTLIKKHLTRPYLNAGTSDAPQWVQIKKATEFTRSMNPETEERDYIADEQPTTELMQYKPSESLTVTMYFGEDDFNLFYSLYKKRATGDEAKMEWLLVYLYEEAWSGGYTYYRAEKTEATVAVDEFNSVDSTMTVSIYENGTPSMGFVYLEDGQPVFVEGELPEAEEKAAESAESASLVTVQDAYGTYALAESIREAMAAEHASETALIAAGLAYDGELASISLVLSASQSLKLVLKFAYGYDNAHYPRDYECTVPGKYSFQVGTAEGKISGISFDYSAMTMEGTYTGGHNDVGTCDGDDSAKHSKGEAVSDETGSGAGACLLAIAKNIAEALQAGSLGKGLSYAGGAISLDGEAIAGR